MRNIRFRDRGMTLVEVLVAMVILTIVAYALFMSFQSSSTTFTNVSGAGTIQENGRLALDDMAKEFRSADQASFVVTTVNGSSQVSFKYATGYTAGAVTWSPTILYNVQTLAGHNGQTLCRWDTSKAGPPQPLPFLRKCCSDYLQPGGFLVTKAGTNVQIQLYLQIPDSQGKMLRTGTPPPVGSGYPTVQTSVTMRDP
jgi:prepilin-type N-terminal cleavage/methylation domain-containing protein